jgi:hypothetical protein
MNEIEKLLVVAGDIANEWRRTNPGGKPSKEQIQRFGELLERLHQQGWDYVLGEANELPDDCLPESYRQRRAQIIEDLEIELAEIASTFRRSPPGSEGRQQAATAYREILEELFRIGTWGGEPQVDAQLPDEDMPAIYKEYWKKQKAKYAAAKRTPP